jgi:hypothetical protein
VLMAIVWSTAFEIVLPGICDAFVASGLVLATTLSCSDKGMRAEHAALHQVLALSPRGARSASPSP